MTRRLPIVVTTFVALLLTACSDHHGAAASATDEGALGTSPGASCAPLSGAELLARMDRTTERVTFVGRYTSKGKRCHPVTGCASPEVYVEDAVRLRIDAKHPADGWGAALESRFPEEIYFRIDPASGVVTGQSYDSARHVLAPLADLVASATTCAFRATWKTRVTRTDGVVEEDESSFEATAPAVQPRPAVGDEPPRPFCDGPALDDAAVVRLFEPATSLLVTGRGEVVEQRSECDGAGCKPWSAETVHFGGQPTYLPVRDERLLEESAEIEVLAAGRFVVRVYDNQNRYPYADVPLKNGVLQAHASMLGRAADLVGKVTRDHLLIEETASVRDPEQGANHVRSRRYVCIPLKRP